MYGYKVSCLYPESGVRREGDRPGAEDLHIYSCHSPMILKSVHPQTCAFDQ